MIFLIAFSISKQNTEPSTNVDIKTKNYSAIDPDYRKKHRAIDVDIEIRGTVNMAIEKHKDVDVNAVVDPDDVKKNRTVNVDIKNHVAIDLDREKYKPVDLNTKIHATIDLDHEKNSRVVDLDIKNQK